MTDLVIRPLALDDLDAALALSTSAGWNQRLDDWRMLLRLAPAGSFAALSDGRIVGTAIGIDYGGFTWIAMMLVDPAYRGRGVGRRLLEAAMAVVPAERPMRLDATPLGRPLYLRYGFEDEALITRHGLDISNGQASNRSSPVRSLTAADLHDLGEQDNQVFGGDRYPVLEWVRESCPQYALLVRSDAGLARYCFGREGRLFDQIGPVVASDDDTARALVSAALVAAGDRPVVLDTFDSRPVFTAWLLGCGFRSQRPLFRMRRPAHLPDSARGVRSGLPLVEFAILGPEFG